MVENFIKENNMSWKDFNLTESIKTWFRKVERAIANNTITVQKDDTLTDLAQKHLGKASRWTEIYDLNRKELTHGPNKIYPGTKLRLPSK
jgi:nucleoid-associated protein YgaU